LHLSPTRRVNLLPDPLVGSLILMISNDIFYNLVNMSPSW
jgi:hypothetical protein